MPFVERVRTHQVVVGSFYHAPGEPTASVEWWPEPCVAFTTFGSWEVHCRRGEGQISPDGVLATEAGAEHDCQHPEGADDRMLCVLYQDETDPGPAVVVRQGTALHSLRRSLVAELRSADADQTEVEALSLALLEAVRQAPAGWPGPGARTRAVVGRLRDEAHVRFLEPDLDLVAESIALGFSRTRFVHVFRDVVGVTPHRYVVELRVGHAARLLRVTAAPVTDICFDSGFGSMPSFYAAFRAAYGTTPTAYRARLTA